jgi:hypothetical protein
LQDAANFWKTIENSLRSVSNPNLFSQGILNVTPLKSRAQPASIPGLLCMADLIVMQPNINIPLYIVAPDKRRKKVITEINRPTFSRLEPSLSEICRFLSF